MRGHEFKRMYAAVISVLTLPLVGLAEELPLNGRSDGLLDVRAGLSWKIGG